jgi:RNA polymerase sigma-70 factor (ECF subfamily)
MNASEEKNIILSIINGQVGAFKTIYNAYVPKMRAIAKRYASTNFEADDILQDAFVKIYTNLNQYKFDGSFEGWI